MNIQPGLFALVAGSLLVGAALYINFVEQPARLALDDRAMTREWITSNRRGLILLTAFAVPSAILAYVQFGLTGDVRWLIGGIVILASWPYAYFVVIPVSVWLWTLPPDAPGSPVRSLVRKWGMLEWGQTAIGLGGCYFMVWALVLPGS